MKIAYSWFMLLLLETSVSSSLASSNSDNNDITESDTSATLNDKIDKNIRRKVLDIVNSVSPLLKNDTPPSLFLYRFIKQLTEYARNQVTIFPKYQLFTPANPQEKFDLEFSRKSLQKSTFDASLETKFLIHGFIVGLPKSSVMFALKDRLLQINDYNVIVVDWTEYNGHLIEYEKASTNAAYVGFEVGKLVQLLMDSKGITAKSIHLIGHSLGGHVAGFTGKVIQDIERISGLDAAGPIFQEFPSYLRLNDTDAEFVDAIHTDGAPIVLIGYGTLLPYADIDFFPNGGSRQPNCSYGILLPFDDISCNHSRAPQLFLESIDKCRFESVHCTSYEDFNEGKCSPETSVISRMGFYANPVPSLPKHSSFFLKTTGTPPYCIQSSGENI